MGVLMMMMMINNKASFLQMSDQYCGQSTDIPLSRSFVKHSLFDKNVVPIINCFLGHFQFKSTLCQDIMSQVNAQYKKSLTRLQLRIEPDGLNINYMWLYWKFSFDGILVGSKTFDDDSIYDTETKSTYGIVVTYSNMVRYFVKNKLGTFETSRINHMIGCDRKSLLIPQLGRHILYSSTGDIHVVSNHFPFSDLYHFTCGRKISKLYYDSSRDMMLMVPLDNPNELLLIEHRQYHPQLGQTKHIMYGSQFTRILFCRNHWLIQTFDQLKIIMPETKTQIKMALPSDYPIQIHQDSGTIFTFDRAYQLQMISLPMLKPNWSSWLCYDYRLGQSLRQQLECPCL